MLHYKNLQNIRVRSLELAIEAHKHQKRKYTGESYIVHPVGVSDILSKYEVCRGLTQSIAFHDWPYKVEFQLSDQHISDIVHSICYLHDTIEDTEETQESLLTKLGFIEGSGYGTEEFNNYVANMIVTGVVYLTDRDTDNRKLRKLKQLERLRNAPSIIQTIKCADVLHNMETIVVHDKKFATVFLEEAYRLVSSFRCLQLRGLALTKIDFYQSEFINQKG